MVAPASPLTEPTDRSISPTSSTTTMPSEMIPTGAANCIIETTVNDDRNDGFLR